MENETSDVSKQQLEASLAQAIGTIRSLKEKLAGRTHSGAGPIAVVGLGCRLPGGADSPRRLWSLLKNATDATGDMPAERRYATDYYDPDPDVPGKAYVMRGGFVEGVERFDAAFFGISPSEAEGMDPQQANRASKLPGKRWSMRLSTRFPSMAASWACSWGQYQRLCTAAPATRRGG